MNAATHSPLERLAERLASHALDVTLGWLEGVARLKIAVHRRLHPWLTRAPSPR